MNERLGRPESKSVAGVGVCRGVSGDCCIYQEIDVESWEMSILSIFLRSLFLLKKER